MMKLGILRATTFLLSIPDCGPTRHGALRSGMSRLLTTKIWARRSWRLKYAASVASDIARVCPVPCGPFSDFAAGFARRAFMA
jgi:hypothetical protein